MTGVNALFVGGPYDGARRQVEQAAKSVALPPPDQPADDAAMAEGPAGGTPRQVGYERRALHLETAGGGRQAYVFFCPADWTHADLVEELIRGYTARETVR